MKKRLTSFLLCFFMCVALIPVSAQATETAEANAPEIPTEGDVWDGSITQPTKLVQKDGVYYYEITKCSELAYVAQIGGDWLGYNYILGNNLILNNAELSWDEEGNLINTAGLLEWMPVGDYDNPFSGKFDGNSFAISGLYISSGDTDSALFGWCSDSSLVSNVSLVNSYTEAKTDCAGIVGASDGSITNCTFNGVVKSSGSCGSICGDFRGTTMSMCVNYGRVYGNSTGGIAGQLVYNSGKMIECTNYGDVKGTGDYCGGIAARADGRITNCNNYGTISGVDDVGGITGETMYEIKNCANYGNVTGLNNVGGIKGNREWYYGHSLVTQCVNYGVITGENAVGGIVGNQDEESSKITLCYNAGKVSGNKNCGGIIGYGRNLTIQQCYNIGNIVIEGDDDSAGGIVGTNGPIWATDTVVDCYYLKTSTVNSEIFGCGGVITSTGSDPNGIVAKETDLMKCRNTYENWDFTSVWSISADKNSGYPYLQWQESMLSDIIVNSVQISETLLSLAKGDYVYLSATISPTNASNKSVTWKSSDSDIAAVSAAGKVTAISAGTTVITATTVDGGYTASCTVTVTERLPEEYKINSITVRDNDGAVLSAIPNGTCLATVSITNLASEGNTLVFLAAYTSTDQYQGMMWVSVEDLPVDATIKVTLPVDNSDGKIANLKAFTIASFSHLTPLGEAVSFLP